MSIQSKNRYYKGVTAHVSQFYAGDYITLHHLVPNIRIKFVPNSYDEDKSNTKRVAVTSAYAYISANHKVFASESRQFPKHTPLRECQAYIQREQIGSYVLYVIYVPIVIEDDNDTQAVAAVSALYELLRNLFTDRLLRVQVQSVGPPHYDMDDSTVKVTRLSTIGAGR